MIGMVVSDVLGMQTAGENLSALIPSFPELDDVVAVAAAICGTEASAVTLIHDGLQTILNTNIELEREVSAEESFCSRTILKDELLEVEDARTDPRFCKSIFVDKDNGIRFYAGMPFSRTDGSRIGALCVFDQQPKILTELQRKTLAVLARQVTARLRDHEHRLQLDKAVHDIEAARRELEASERRFKAFMDSSPLSACLKDAEGRYVYINEPYATTIRADVLGKTDEELWGSELAFIYRKYDLEALAAGGVQIRDEEVLSQNGSRSYWRAYRFPVTDEAGHVHLGAMGIDITRDHVREQELRRVEEELRAANDQLQELAMMDALTGLHNRRSFDILLREKSSLAQSSSRPLSVLLLDVDHFKQHNDLFGHASGDTVLKQVAYVLTAVVRKEDVIGRLGGEEFAVIMPNSTEEEGESLALRIIRAIHAFPWENAPVTVSIGIAGLTPSATPSTLLREADIAMYAAKRHGRNRTMRISEVEAIRKAEMVEEPEAVNA